MERYDESLVALVHMVRQLGGSLDLACPCVMNAKRLAQEVELAAESLPRELLLESTELDEKLHQRVVARLDERIENIADFEERLHDFRIRGERLSESPPGIKIKPPRQWTHLSALKP